MRIVVQVALHLNSQYITLFSVYFNMSFGLKESVSRAFKVHKFVKKTLMDFQS
ncbi:hypothetical protein J2Y45_003559 [Dyadobacter sp. BE34]|uniref:Uncharacterized protein n=1 Tax=Dyadobacter fermentans TaxID=94254 RepID=A0ABU1QYY5_9BACT|nr:hypothetical protein [Dyadobacter fermentans]MDR7044108.1 hypothetical protein [Dyadobacter sp. BE242]MDR7198419.1 hypothetical protein [Dyadobacter sp. BE34]MDR7216381.1 hypothetical protein [Dyadobacter sp. BE31]MDR7264092.1 hypothetical protein [Dyadobacter sp. BE32]